MHPLIVAAAGTLIGNYFQNRAEKKKMKLQRYQRQMDEAHKLFDELTTVLSSRLYLGSRMFQRLCNVKASEKDFKKSPQFISAMEYQREYDKNLDTYNIKRVSYENRLKSLFGAEITTDFVEKVHGYIEEKGPQHRTGLRQLATLIAASIQQVKEGDPITLDQEKDFETAFYQEAAPQITKFYEDLSKIMQNDQFGDRLPENQQTGIIGYWGI